MTRRRLSVKLMSFSTNMVKTRTKMNRTRNIIHPKTKQVKYNWHFQQYWQIALSYETDSYYCKKDIIWETCKVNFNIMCIFIASYYLIMMLLYHCIIPKEPYTLKTSFLKVRVIGCSCLIEIIRVMKVIRR